MKEENKKIEKKSHKKAIIITISILVVLIIAIAVGYFMHQNIEKNKTVGTEWGDKYYLYLEEAKQSDINLRQTNYGIENNTQNTTIEFTEIIENEAPQMIMNYKKENENYITIYYINKEDNIEFVKNENPATIELLYNIEKEEYIWYLHTKEGDNEKYIPVKNIISEEKEQEYVFTPEELITTDEKISKFDETFIIPENVESKKVEFNIESSKEELKELIEKTVEEYETKEQIVTEEVKKDIQDKKTNLDTKKEEIKKAEEERIKQEEEAKRLAEEEAKKAEEEAKKAAQQNKTTTTNTSKTQQTTPSTKNTGEISKEQAEKLAQKRWGTVADNGYEMGYSYIAKVKDTSGKQYYAFRVSWRVDDGGGTSHWSTLDTVFIATDGKTYKESGSPGWYSDGEVVKSFDGGGNL